MYCENVPFVGTFADTNALSLYGLGVPTAKTYGEKKFIKQYNYFNHKTEYSKILSKMKFKTLSNL